MGVRLRGMSQGISPRRRRHLLLVFLGVVAVWLLGTAFLFTGTEVECGERVADDGGPELRCAFTVGAAPEAVWQAFTTTGEPQRHYFDAVLETQVQRPGSEVGQPARGRWRFVTSDRQRLLADGEIVAFEPPRRFVQSFRAADLDDRRAESRSRSRRGRNLRVAECRWYTIDSSGKPPPTAVSGGPIPWRSPHSRQWSRPVNCPCVLGSTR